jgi:hypothetical protein
MAGNFTVFTNDSGSAGGAVDFVRDAFKDITIPAKNNSGLTDTANTNPLGQYFGNSDVPRYGEKTLFIKDLVLISDRTKWVSNKPTYQVVFTEPAPYISAYVFGNPTLPKKQGLLAHELQGQSVVQINTTGDGMGVTGVVRRVAWLVNDDTSATATAQLATDGVNTTTIDFSALTANSDSTTNPRFSVFSHAASNATQDLHSYRITSLQDTTLKLVGVSVYFENATQTIDAPSGTTYVDKSKITTTSTSTLAVPTYGSSLGGVAAIYKTQNTGYLTNNQSSTSIISIAQGSSGTNLVNVTTGQGGSYLAGYGIVILAGASNYIGSISSVSTDTLTVSPTLPFGVSNVIYSAWKAGSTVTIGSTIFSLTSQLDVSRYLGCSIPFNSDPILDLQGRYALFSSNTGLTTILNSPVMSFKGASGFIQIDGYFSAAEIESNGIGIFNAVVSVNGAPGYTINTGQTGAIRRSLVTDAGSGWNSVVIQPGTSMGASLGITKFNFYNSINQGVTFGVLSQMRTNQAYTDRSGINCTLIALGTQRRVYADQLFLQGGWVRALDSTVAGGVKYSGASTNSAFQIQYYGKNFALVGTPGSSGILTLDGSNIGVTFGVMRTVTTEGYHTLTYSNQAGTCVIHAFDFARSSGEVINVQNITDNLIPTLPSTDTEFKVSEVLVSGPNGNGSANTKIRRFLNVVRNEGDAIIYTDSSTLGSLFTINRDGIYAISYTDGFNVGAYVGISVDATQLTTQVSGINIDNIVAYNVTPAGNISNASSQITLRKGQLIRAHCAGDADNPTNIFFRITLLRGL